MKAKGWFNRHKDLLALTFLFASFRFFSLMLLRPGGFIADYSDFNTSFLPFAQWSRYALYPYRDFWMEYPPLFPWLVVFLYRLSLLLPPWDDPRLWFNTLMGLITLASETGNLVIIYLLGCSLWGCEKGRLAGWFYLGLFAPFYTALGWFDTVPLFFILLTLWLWMEVVRKTGKRVTIAFAGASGIALGIGFMLKLLPALALPLSIRIMPKRKELFAIAAGFTITVLLIALPFFLQNPFLFITSFRSMIRRSSWETVWALLDNYYSFGTVAGDRFSIPSSFETHPARVPGIIPLLLWALIYLWLLYHRDERGNPRNAVSALGLVFTSYLMLSLGYSPQHVVYAIPFIVLLMPDLKGIAYLLLLTWFNLMEATGYFIMFPNQRWLLVLTVSLRTLTFLALSVEYAIEITGNRLFNLRKFAFAGWLAASSIAMILSIPLLGKAYFQARLSYAPCREVALTIPKYKPPDDVAILFVDGKLHDQLYPYGLFRFHVYLLPAEALSSDSRDEERAKFLKQLGARHKSLWVIANHENAVEREAISWLDGFLGHGEILLEAGQCMVVSYTLR